ncbi:uncharacterized protein NECHADRAFT_94964 [Fusarium vanettenii 77-13-4]|uniref:Aminotransferase class V domain-containing protein n=1 Tax=Fusarium vanettenii (strain ATCC MYA-4622 / CBS 123669 / FGSC 9596 / NRRL 45880 / 77-13-4) TaxID=660122 RepID=C7YXS9_FUSV7|nr:uncharacterized protein NECHADRAFT_94964 [Fusarium vanettenii 77-13-4]EEU43397.1 hypothetical protein NECHADRAFT_94964 [Fusarium vanettenii 77-13-4]
MSKLDVSAIRAAFPALQQDQVFLDNAGGSQTLGTVIDSIRDYLSNNNVQLGATYPVGQKCNALFDEGEAAGARYINASTNEIVFGSSTTQLFRNLSFTLQFNEGDELVVSQVDHEANIASWVDLAARQKLVLKWWKPKDLNNPKLFASDLPELLSPRTRLVTCTHSSNILGTIHDIPAIAREVHKIPGAMLCVDGVAYAPHRPIDVKAFGVDFYCFSWYKVYGPHVSMLYASHGAQKHMKSLGHFFNPSATLKDKLALAGGNYELVQSISKVVEYLTSGAHEWESMIAHEAELSSVLLEYLNSRPEITVRGETSADSSKRLATVSFSIDGWSPRKFVETVEAQSNYGFRWGAFYSNRLVCELLGQTDEGIVRISMAHYTTVDEIKGIIAVMDKVLSSP